jgi:hypothetical protein
LTKPEIEILGDVSDALLDKVWVLGATIVMELEPISVLPPPDDSITGAGVDDSELVCAVDWLLEVTLVEFDEARVMLFVCVVFVVTALEVWLLTGVDDVVLVEDLVEFELLVEFETLDDVVEFVLDVAPWEVPVPLLDVCCDVLLEDWDVVPPVDVLLEDWDCVVPPVDVLLEDWDCVVPPVDVLLEDWDVVPVLDVVLDCVVPVFVLLEDWDCVVPVFVLLE